MPKVILSLSGNNTIIHQLRVALVSILRNFNLLGNPDDPTAETHWQGQRSIQPQRGKWTVPPLPPQANKTLPPVVF